MRAAAETSDAVAGKAAGGPAMAAWHRRAVAAAMLTLIVSELTYLFGRFESAQATAHAALVAFFCLGLPLMRMREAYLAGIAAFLTALLLGFGATPAATLVKALDQAAFLVTFILAIGLLREAAVTSQAVVTCGLFMTRQPAGRRYIAVQLGGTLIGALINLGAISLLAPLVQRGVREDRGKGAAHWVVTRVRERRQLTALSRGFSWALNWSPTTVTLAVLPAVLPDVHLSQLVPAGIALSAVMLAIGWLEDRIRFRNLRRLLMTRGWMPEIEPMRFPVRAFLALLGVCTALAGLTALFRAWGGVATVPGLLLAAPIVLVGWVLAQNRYSPPRLALQRTGRQLAHVAMRAMPATAREAMTLSTSGFIGIVGAALVPMAQAAQALGLHVMPQWLFLFMLPVLMLAVGQIGPSPVMMVILLGTLIGSMPELPADPTLIGIALAAGGAVATTVTPFASGVIVLSRVTGHPTTTISWRWNLPFALAALGVLAVVFPLLTGGR